MSVYGLPQLFDECTSRQGKLAKELPKERKKELVQEAWNACNAWIEEQFNKNKGASISTFGTLTWEVISVKDGQSRRKPVFIISENYAKGHNIFYKKVVKAPDLIHPEEINFSKIAIRYSQSLTKDLVFSLLREIFHLIGAAAGSGRRVNIPLSVGTLLSEERRLSLQFFPEVIKKGNGNQVADCEARESELGNQNNLAAAVKAIIADSGTSGAGAKAVAVANAATTGTFSGIGKTDIEEALESLDVSRPEGDLQIDSLELAVGDSDLEHPEAFIHKRISLNDSDVMDNAYKRYLLDVASKQLRDMQEAKQVAIQKARLDEQLTGQREKRLQAIKETQDFIKDQMKGREEQKRKEMETWRSQMPTAYPAKLEGTKYMLSRPRDRYTDTAAYQAAAKEEGGMEIKAQQQELFRTLQSQISDKALKTETDKVQQLLEDRKLIASVNGEVVDIKKKQQEIAAKKKKYLMDSWKRDQEVKQLLKEHQQQLSSPKSPFPSLSPGKIRSPSRVQQTGLVDLSVGFDIRLAGGDFEEKDP